jgi:hypothetical protein
MAASGESPKTFPPQFPAALAAPSSYCCEATNRQIYILWDKEPGADYIKSAGAHEMFVASATFWVLVRPASSISNGRPIGALA